MDKAEKSIRLGQEAKLLINNTTLKGVISSIRDEQYRVIEATKATQADDREEAYYLLRAIRLLEQRLGSIIRQGSIEENKMIQPIVTSIIQR